MSLVLPSEIVVGVIVVAILFVIGDYIGYKIGRMRLAIVSGVSVLIVVVLFAIYAVLFALFHWGS